MTGAPGGRHPRMRYPQNRSKRIPGKRPISSPSPLSDIMQAMDQRPQKTSITVSTHIKERVCSRKRGNQTYDDVLEQMLNISDIGDEGKASGVVFLYSVPIGADNEMKKLKSPLPLLLHVDEKNGFIDLANNEFKILVSCKTLEEALEEAGLQFSDSFDEYNDPSIPMTTAAKEFGKKLRDAVWL